MRLLDGSLLSERAPVDPGSKTLPADTAVTTPVVVLAALAVAAEAVTALIEPEPESEPAVAVVADAESVEAKSVGTVPAEIESEAAARPELSLMVPLLVVDKSVVAPPVSDIVEVETVIAVAAEAVATALTQVKSAADSLQPVAASMPFRKTDKTLHLA